jgi:hypothetical protein
MMHNFAEEQTDYVGVMQGFALLYASLLSEASQARGSLHWFMGKSGLRPFFGHQLRCRPQC